jgi:hypothetical protein
MRPRVYVASKSAAWPWWSALRAAGLPIISSWLDWSRNKDGVEPTADEWRRHSERCFEEAADCDILLLHVQPGEQHFGALLEAAAALTAGKQVYLVSCHEWPFLRHHPRVFSYDTLERAVEAIVAACRGVID